MIALKAMTTVWEQIAALSGGLMMRCSIHGHKYDATLAARLANVLHEHGFTSMVQLDYINWTVETCLKNGFCRGDVHH